MSPFFRSAFRAAAALAFLASLPAASAHGQQPPGRSTLERLLRERQKTIYNRAMEDELRKPAGHEEELRLALDQIKEDYEHIQLVNNELAKATSDPAALDLRLAGESASEIRKRAERLLTNLALPDVPADMERVKMPSEGEGQLRPSLVMLRRLVERFVRSPLFRDVNVIDAQVSTRTRRDLEGIVELSGRLKRDCEKYHRGSH
ncbi:MAG TPA: hypothetical protein VF659_15715 [Pyrinomonadaceae bacterium]|jgi:hypothetical protein